MANGIDLAELCADVLRSLTAGRSEATPVLVMAGSRGGEGKSFFLKPLISVYGHEYVFPAPEPGSFPLIDLPGKKVALLDDWRFDKSVLPFCHTMPVVLLMDNILHHFYDVKAPFARYTAPSFACATTRPPPSPRVQC